MYRTHRDAEALDVLQQLRRVVDLRALQFEALRVLGFPVDATERESATFKKSQCQLDRALEVPWNN